jgi:hypothetical protein
MEKNPRQAKIDALLAAIGIGDKAMIISCCKGIQNTDFQLIVTKVCLKPIRKDDESDVNAAGWALVPVATTTATTTTTTTTTAEKEEEVGDANVGGGAPTAVESTVVVKSPPSYLSVVKSGFGNKQTKQSTVTVTPTGKICRRLMDTGICEEKKSCQHLHPVKCSYYAGFGLARVNPKGCKSTDCKFLHVVICRFKYKALCKKQLCSLQHLQPKAVEKKAKVQPEIVHHQPKETPTTASF